MHECLDIAAENALEERRLADDWLHSEILVFLQFIVWLALLVFGCGPVKANLGAFRPALLAEQFPEDSRPRYGGSHWLTGVRHCSGSGSAQSGWRHRYGYQTRPQIKQMPLADSPHMSLFRS